MPIKSPGRLVLAFVIVSIFVLPSALAAETQVLFDLPDTIECTDVTPKTFAVNNPTLKVIEAKLRISGRIPEGSEADLADFLYMITSPGLRLKIQDYLPNTTLESTVQGDQIEITDTSESTNATAEDAHICYKVLGLGGTANQGSKKSESSKYKQIAPKVLVVASGTINREHGVFFKLRPSKDASLEGAKTFTFLAIVAKEWRGDWCAISCAARANKKSYFLKGIIPVGIDQAHVGMYLAGDREARFRADELYEVQEANGSVLSTHVRQHKNALVDSMHAATTGDHKDGNWLHSIFSSFTGSENQGDKSQADSDEVQGKREVQKEMTEAQERLGRLSGSKS